MSLVKPDTEQYSINRNTLVNWIKEFVDSRNALSKDEFYCTEREIAEDVMQEFLDFVWENPEKVTRQARIAELEAEIERLRAEDNNKEI